MERYASDAMSKTMLIHRPLAEERTTCHNPSDLSPTLKVTFHQSALWCRSDSGAQRVHLGQQARKRERPGRGRRV